MVSDVPMCVSESVIVFFFSVRFSRGSWSDGLGLCRRGETQCADLRVRFEEPRGDVRARGLGQPWNDAVASVGVCSSQKHHPRGFGPFTHTRGVTPVLTQYANEARETSHPALRPAKRTFFVIRASKAVLPHGLRLWETQLAVSPPSRQCRRPSCGTGGSVLSGK